MNNLQVKSIDEQSIIERLKKSGDKETLNYIRALKDSAKNWQDIANKAIKKLKNERI